MLLPLSNAERFFYINYSNFKIKKLLDVFSSVTDTYLLSLMLVDAPHKRLPAVSDEALIKYFVLKINASIKCLICVYH